MASSPSCKYPILRSPPDPYFTCSQLCYALGFKKGTSVYYTSERCYIAKIYDLPGERYNPRISVTLCGVDGQLISATIFAIRHENERFCRDRKEFDRKVKETIVKFRRQIPESISLEESRRLCEAAGFKLLTTVEVRIKENNSYSGLIVGYIQGIGKEPYLLILTIDGRVQAISLSRLHLIKEILNFLTIDWKDSIDDYSCGYHPGSILIDSSLKLLYFITETICDRGKNNFCIATSISDSSDEIVINVLDTEWYLERNSDLSILQRNGINGYEHTFNNGKKTTKTLPNLFAPSTK